MDKIQIRETPIWQLYEIGQNFHRRKNWYTETDRNHQFYNGDQWDGAILGDVEPIQKNFIKPIVKYKVGVIHDNLYAIHYSSQNFESIQFQQEAEKYCEMINRYVHRSWENDKMDYKLRRVSKDSAINGEGIMYVDFDAEKMQPLHEVVDKTDVYYGNENDEDIQKQPYILIRKRMPVSEARAFAIAKGLSEKESEMIIGDNETFEEAGKDAKEEVDDMATIIYKLYKVDGKVNFAIACRWITILDDVETGLELYPLAHFNWEERKGSARGEGEVRTLIPNQIEVNKVEIRRAIAVKTQAFPQKVVDGSKISNISDLDIAGAIIETNGSPVEDVNKVVGTIQPAQMSTDVKQLLDDLIQMSRDLAGAGDIATGNVNPEDASGRAILAVQQASQSPITEQKESFKAFAEDLARIDLNYLIVHSTNGINMEQEVDMGNGQKAIQVVNVPQSVMEQLQATVKIDVTPKSVYDRFAKEQTVENLLMNGFFTAQRVGEMEVYAKLLDDDSVAPKVEIEEACKTIRAEQQRIAMMQAQSQAMIQRASQFINGDIDEQAQMMSDAQMQAQMMQQAQQEVPMDDDMGDE